MIKKMVLGLTMGDPGGVGPELCMTVIQKIIASDIRFTGDVVLFGSRSFFEQGPLKHSFASIVPNIRFVDIDVVELSVNSNHNNFGFTFNKPSETNGITSFCSVQKAIEWANKGLVDAIVTAPINKTSWEMAGVGHTGHTTLLASMGVHLEGKEGYKVPVSMGFYSKKLKTVLASVHIPLSQVPAAITHECLRHTLDSCLRLMSLTGKGAPELERAPESRPSSIQGPIQGSIQKPDPFSPHIALAGLNPHAGEGGMFGDEELKTLEPFVASFQSENHRKKFLDKAGITTLSDFELSGPYPPDTLYYRAAKGDFDCVLSLYHDQGLIPLKLIAFDEAVNITLGLSFIRTSPDHGTAYDIAYQEKPNSQSMEEATILAIQCIEGAR